MFELTFNIISLLIAISFIIAIMFAGLLICRKRFSSRGDLFLAALMLIVALWNASILIFDLHLHRYAIGIIWVPLKFTLALGPCFYFYVRYITDFKLKQKIKIWPHFIPVFIEVIIFLVQVYQGIPLRLGYFQTDTFFFFDPILNGTAIVSLLIYGYLARQRIKQYHEWVKDNFSHAHKYNVNWLYRLSTVFLCFLSMWFAYFIVDYFVYDYKLTFYDYYPFHLTLALISIWLSTEAFLKPDIIYPEHVFNSGEVLSEEIHTNIQTAQHPPSLDEEIRHKALWLKKQIEENLLYLDPDLSLKSLADTLNIHPNLASKIVNEGLKLTFSDCINQFRVQAVMNKLHDPKFDKTTFLAIAFDCGFNSKTTFNRVFKKQIGQTPLQYRKNLPKR